MPSPGKLSSAGLLTSERRTALNLANLYIYASARCGLAHMFRMYDKTIAPAAEASLQKFSRGMRRIVVARQNAGEGKSRSGSEKKSLSGTGELGLWGVNGGRVFVQTLRRRALTMLASVDELRRGLNLGRFGLCHVFAVFSRVIWSSVRGLAESLNRAEASAGRWSP